MRSERQYPYVCPACGHEGLTARLGRALRCIRCQSRTARIEEWDGWVEARLGRELKQTVGEQRKAARALEKKYVEAVKSIVITADKEGRVRGNPDL